jgi:hypothetical protein
MSTKPTPSPTTDTRAPKVAALFVEAGGVYDGRHDVDCWPVERDARLYRGPWPAVAHPPCERWGRYWLGGPSAKVPRTLGDDSGCFAAAWRAVLDFGGLIEHPEGSHGWTVFDLPRPRFGGGWTPPDRLGGRSISIDQGAYGHPARKRTWLYACHIDFPELVIVDASGRQRLEPGFHSAEEARARRADPDYRPIKRLTRDERVCTPPAFAELLLSMARTATADTRAQEAP